MVTCLNDSSKHFNKKCSFLTHKNVADGSVSFSTRTVCLHIPQGGVVVAYVKAERSLKVFRTIFQTHHHGFQQSTVYWIKWQPHTVKLFARGMVAGEHGAGMGGSWLKGSKRNNSAQVRHAPGAGIGKGEQGVIWLAARAVRYITSHHHHHHPWCCCVVSL